MHSKISVIIPIYNKQNALDGCIRSLRRQTYPFAELEVLLIDDGSTDGSGALAQSLAGEYANICVFTQENRGVCAARNVGIRHAAGKYLFFLDADDALSRDCIKSVSDFFDTLPEDVELVTYRIGTICEGKKLGAHFRYQFLSESGVYDLREHPYIGQTTINVAVRNRGADNVLFDEGLSFLEDQKYCCAVLRDSLKMGYCAQGEYLYHRDASGTAGKLSGACYIFEQSMAMFEEIFAWYNELQPAGEEPQPAGEESQPAGEESQPAGEESQPAGGALETACGSADSGVPAAFQGLYVFDLYWKLCDHILLPYHYGEEDYARALRRIRALLLRCDTGVIMHYPQIDFYEKFYLLRLRGGDTLRPVVTRDCYALTEDGQVLLRENSPRIVLTRLVIGDGRLRLYGHVESAFFPFCETKPVLCAVENDGFLTRKLSLFDSAYSYYKSLERTQCFPAFRYEADLAKVRNVRFELGFHNKWFPAHYAFGPLCPFSYTQQRLRIDQKGVTAALAEDGTLHFAQAAGGQTKPSVRQSEEPVWLYYDCAGCAIDNGGWQFLHDVRKADGIRRYYIVTDERQRERLRAEWAADGRGGSFPESCLLSFGSTEHKRLLESCKKVLTAYIEEANLFPYDPEGMEKRADRFAFETIYLQHGVLHIEMPWKFSPERIRADKVVVSTVRERELYRRYGFAPQDLIGSGMARFDRLDRTGKKCKKILFAPSWRLYLTGPYRDRQWGRLDEKFLHSQYFAGIKAFIEDARLHRLLFETGWRMEVKPHPIFSCYADRLQSGSPLITTVTGSVCEEEYGLMITDFSSYAYDFYYLGTPVLYYLPDPDAFFSGMNGYRVLDDPPDYRDRAARTPDAILAQITRFLREGMAESYACEFLPFADSAQELYRVLTTDRTDGRDPEQDSL